MSASEVNFSFNGLHCLRDFGCVYIANENGRTISPATERDEYDIAGVSGTVLIGQRAKHNPFTMSGVLVPMKTPKTLQAAQQLARDVAAWLKVGRRKLSFDYEPLYQHDAEVQSAITWDTRVWMDGGIAITFLVQPYTRDLTPATAQKAMVAGGDSLFVPVNTVDPCPVSFTIKNTGSSAITSIKITDPNGKTVELAKGMSLAVGATLTLNMEPPIGAEISTGTASTNALRYAVRFDQLTLQEPDYLTFVMDGPALVTATAWGCLL